MNRSRWIRAGLVTAACLYIPVAITLATSAGGSKPRRAFDEVVGAHVSAMMEEGKRTFRFDTFGDESFWGDVLHLHQAIEGQAHGGVGDGLTPRAALGLGLKVDLR
jgi:hypothetical protein